MNLSALSGLDDEAEVNEAVYSEYSSNLGGAAWTVLTRADTAIYIQALQRRGAKPRVIDCKRLNLVV